MANHGLGKLIRSGLIGLAMVFVIQWSGAQAVAATITGVTAVASSTISGGTLDRYVTNIVNGAGLDVNGPGTHSVGAEGVFWLSDIPCVPSNQWVVFTLPGFYELTGAKVWNYNESGSMLYAGVKTMNILVSSDGVNYTDLGLKSLSLAPGNATAAFGDTFTLSGTGIRYVKFAIQTTWDAPNYVGLSEVQFFGTLLPGFGQITGVTAVASSTSSGGTLDRYVTNIVNGAGLDVNGPGTHSVGAEGVFWLSDIPCVPSNQWVVFTLPGYYDLAWTKVWNYNEVGSMLYAGVETMNILISSDGVNYTDLGLKSLSLAPGNAITAFGDTLALSGTKIRYVKFAIRTTWSAPTYVGLSEVQFFGMPTQPSGIVFKFH